MTTRNPIALETASIRDFRAVNSRQSSAALSFGAEQGIFEVKFAANMGKNRDMKMGYSHAPARAAGDTKPVVNNL
jgi:hypothetical protein